MHRNNLKPNQALNILAGDPLQHVVKYLTHQEVARLLRVANPIKPKMQTLRSTLNQNFSAQINLDLAQALEIKQYDIKDEAKVSQAHQNLHTLNRRTNRAKCCIAATTIVGTTLILLGSLLDMKDNSRLACIIPGVLIDTPAFLFGLELSKNKCSQIAERVRAIRIPMGATTLYRNLFGTNPLQDAQRPILADDEADEKQNGQHNSYGLV